MQILTAVFFHLAQSVWRKVQDYGLQERYLTDDNFREAIKMVPALAFVPPNDVVKSFELLQTTFENDNDVQRVLDYFEEVYIGRLRRHHHANPLFPIHVWNCYDATADRLPHTNNNVEGWHSAFQAMLGLTHPNIYLLVDALIKEQSLMEMKRVRAMAGEIILLCSKVTYAQIDKRLQTVIGDYANSDRLSYLRACCYNYDF